MRRRFLTRMAAAAAAVAAPRAFAQSAAYPNRPVRVIVAFAPGGSVDPIIRIAQPKLQDLLGQPVVLDNRPGGSTAIAATAVFRSPPDGYNFLFTACSTHVIHTLGGASVPYDPIEDFQPIACFSRSGWAMVVHPSVPARTIAEYVAYCKANPNKLSYCSLGVGNANHLAMEQFNRAAGIQTVHVPYKAAGPAYLDLQAGRVQAAFTSRSTQQAAINQGTLRALAYTATPPGEVPPAMTMAGAGYPQLENVDSINIMLAPRGLPPAITTRVSSAVQTVLEMPDVKAAIGAQQAYPFYMSPTQLHDRLRTELASFRKIIQDAKIKLEG